MSDVIASSASPQIRTRCECCDGTGRRPLTGIEARTLAAVGEDWTDTGVIAVAFPRTNRTALIERLNRLASTGLIEKRPCEDHGGRRQWRLSPPTLWVPRG